MIKIDMGYARQHSYEGVLGIVDVTRTKIYEPYYEAPKYWSAKDQFSALKYEVVVNVVGPERIVWFNGPYKGAAADITIYRHRLRLALTPFECLLADGGYPGAENLVIPHRNYPNKVLTADRVRFTNAIHTLRQTIERVNARLKVFKIMCEYRGNDYEFHGKCARVISKVLNFVFATSQPLSANR